MISLRHHLIFAALRCPIALYLRLKLGFRAVRGPHLPYGQPAVILANHNSGWDPFMISFSIKRAIYFVASDHIFRLGILSRVIQFLVAPIPIVKAQIDLRAQRTIRQVIQEGGIVGLFPEGNRSFSGLTGWIFPSIGKLIKQLKCPLILYRIEGGYLATPRWTHGPRRGRITGHVARVVSTDELAALPAEAVNQIIRTSLDVDAYADQKANPIRYQGKNLAEYLERALFICPRCQNMATLHSQGDHLHCTCGLVVRYNEFGFFEPVDVWSAEQQQAGTFLATVTDWDHWQRETLVSWVRDSGGPIDWSGTQTLFRDEEERLYNCERATRNVLLDEGALALYADRLEWHGRQGSQRYLLADLLRLVVHGPQTLQFATQDGRIFELRSKLHRSAYKYATLYQLLEQRRKGEKPGFYDI